MLLLSLMQLVWLKCSDCKVDLRGESWLQGMPKEGLTASRSTNQMRLSPASKHLPLQAHESPSQCSSNFGFKMLRSETGTKAMPQFE